MVFQMKFWAFFLRDRYVWAKFSEFFAFCDFFALQAISKSLTYGKLIFSDYLYAIDRVLSNKVNLKSANRKTFLIEKGGIDNNIVIRYFRYEKNINIVYNPKPC